MMRAQDCYFKRKNLLQVLLGLMVVRHEATSACAQIKVHVLSWPLTTCSNDFSKIVQPFCTVGIYGALVLFEK